MRGRAWNRLQIAIRHQADQTAGTNPAAGIHRIGAGGGRKRTVNQWVLRAERAREIEHIME